MKVGLTRDQCNNFKEIISSKDKEIKVLHDYIDGLSCYFKQAQSIGNKVHNLIINLVKPIQPMTLEKYADLSKIKGHNKKYLQSLFKRYINFCKENLKISDYKVIDGCPLDINLDIYNPDNVLKFIDEKCNFERSSVKKIRDIFLLALRKCTRNPSLEYSVPLGNSEPPNIKHYIKLEELQNFLDYLRDNKDFQLFVLFELLYKFGIRVGAISKLKVKDIENDGTIIFHEKNNKIIKRKLKEKLFEKIKLLIKSNDRDDNDFLFYPSLNPNNLEERDKLMSNKLSKILKESGCFDRKENETISAHMFRATHAVNIFSKFGLQMAANELNHSSSSTTNKHYLKIEDRGLLNNEEKILFNNEIDEVLFGEYKNKKNFKNIVIKNKKQNKKNNKEKIHDNNPENLDLSESELIEDDNSIYDSVFDFKFKAFEEERKNGEDKIFLNKKRERYNNNNQSEKNLYFSSDEEYTKFINENNIEFSTIKVEQIKSHEKSKISTQNEKNFKSYLKKNNFNFEYKNENSLNKINSITKAYTYENVKFFSIDTLKKINNYIEAINDYNYDLFKIILKNNEISVYSNKNIESGTFIDNIYGYNTFRKTGDYKEKNKNGFSDILLFKCKDSKYDRFLKSSLNVNLGAIIANSRKFPDSNCDLIKYIDLNLEVKVGITTKKNIRKGEQLKL